MMQTKKSYKKLLAFMGPAYLVSLGDIDSGNWATDIAEVSGTAIGLNLIFSYSNYIWGTNYRF